MNVFQRILSAIRGNSTTMTVNESVWFSEPDDSEIAWVSGVDDKNIYVTFRNGKTYSAPLLEHPIILKDDE